MKKLVALLLSICILLVAAAAMAADTPTFVFADAITVIVPFKAGSATDNQIRLMQPALEKELGVTLVIVNADGASGTIGTTEYLNNYAADGYTILYALATPVVYKPLTGSTAYQYDDLKPVAMTSSQPMYLILSDDSPFKSAEEVITYIKDNPGEFTYANVGNGGNGHLAFASFLQGEGLDAVSVPYSGGTAECYTATMGGETNACVYGEADLLARPDCHGVINLGSKSTNEKLKDVPTLSELGYQGYETNNMAAFYYNKNVSDEAVAAFAAAVKAVFEDPEFVATATAAGFIPSFAPADKLDAVSRQIMETALPVMKALGY